MGPYIESQDREVTHMITPKGNVTWNRIWSTKHYGPFHLTNKMQERWSYVASTPEEHSSHYEIETLCRGWVYQWEKGALPMSQEILAAKHSHHEVDPSKVPFENQHPVWEPKPYSSQNADSWTICTDTVIKSEIGFYLANKTNEPRNTCCKTCSPWSQAW